MTRIAPVYDLMSLHNRNFYEGNSIHLSCWGDFSQGIRHRYWNTHDIVCINICVNICIYIYVNQPFEMPANWNQTEDESATLSIHLAPRKWPQAMCRYKNIIYEYWYIYIYVQYIRYSKHTVYIMFVFISLYFLEIQNPFCFHVGFCESVSQFISMTLSGLTLGSCRLSTMARRIQTKKGNWHLEYRLNLVVPMIPLISVDGTSILRKVWTPMLFQFMAILLPAKTLHYEWNIIQTCWQHLHCLIQFNPPLI